MHVRFVSIDASDGAHAETHGRATLQLSGGGVRLQCRAVLARHEAYAAPAPGGTPGANLLRAILHNPPQNCPSLCASRRLTSLEKLLDCLRFGSAAGCRRALRRRRRSRTGSGALRRGWRVVWPPSSAPRCHPSSASRSSGAPRRSPWQAHNDRFPLCWRARCCLLTEGVSAQGAAGGMAGMAGTPAAVGAHLEAVRRNCPSLCASSAD